MLVGGVVEHQIEHDVQAPVVRGVDEFDRRVERAVLRRDPV